MRVLVVENYGGTGLGQVGDMLTEAGATVEIVRPYAGDRLPGSQIYDGLVVLGGAQNALDDENHPWFPATLDLIRSFQDSDRSVLGICLGAQLLARANGATNRIGGHHEFGWREVELTPETADDPVFNSLPDRFPIFEWHDDHFDLPERAVRLAHSPVAENQAFRVGRAGYGVQFHFEADRKLVAQWSQDFAEILDAREPGWNAGDHADQAALRGEAADAAGQMIARAWVATISPATGSIRRTTARE